MDLELLLLLLLPLLLLGFELFTELPRPVVLPSLSVDGLVLDVDWLLLLLVVAFPVLGTKLGEVTELEAIEDEDVDG